MGGRPDRGARGRTAALLGLRSYAAIRGARRPSLVVYHARARPHAGDRPPQHQPRGGLVLEIANRWLATFEKALAGHDGVLLESLFHPDCHWRDVLALTWRIDAVNGRDAVLGELKAHARRARPSGFRIDSHRTAPRRVTRAGTEAIEAFFRFETAAGRCNGILRLLPEDKNAPRAWTLLTELDELKGHEETVGKARPKG